MKKLFPSLLILGFLASCDLFSTPGLHLVGPDGDYVEGRSIVLDAPEDFRYKLVAEGGFGNYGRIDCTLTVEVTESSYGDPAESEEFSIYWDDEIDLDTEVWWLPLHLAHTYEAKVTVNVVDDQGVAFDPLTLDLRFTHKEWGLPGERQDFGVTARIVEECDKGQGYRIKGELDYEGDDHWYVISLTEPTRLRLDRVTELSQSNLVQVIEDSALGNILDSVGVG
ncbi:MAG TPA: hypothetical protein PKW82_09540, partial [Spirochaetales bacterium]|nr:hypothetical protein [Spirochaetales bacterium]